MITNSPMNGQVKRLYAGKDSEMIIAIDTITDIAIVDKEFLIAKRPNWQDPFFGTLKSDIDAIVRDHFGADNARTLRQHTQTLLGIAKNAKRDLAEAKVQLDEDFRKTPERRDELLRVLGFTDYLKAVQNDDQEALISLLYRYQTNMDDTLMLEIIGKGTPATTINAIIGYAGVLRTANVNQEGAKGARVLDTEAMILAFNDIYERVISVANISKKFFAEDKVKAGRYSYTKVLATINAHAGKGGDSPIPPNVVG